MRQQSNRPYVTKREIAAAMKELESGVDHRKKPYKKLREKLSMETYNDSSDDSSLDDGDDQKDDDEIKEMYARHMGGMA